MRELTLPAPLVLLPGLGADRSMYVRQREAFGDDMVRTPEWITPQGNEPVHRYAKRWAEAIGPSLPETWFLGGQSFGGMLALDVARFVEPQPKAVFLIASARTPDAVPLAARVLGALARPMSAPMLQRGLQAMAIPFGKLNGADDEMLGILTHMAKHGDAELNEWAVAAVNDWDGLGGSDADRPPVFQIHGRRDKVLRCIPEHCDQVIPDGQHLIQYTHSQTVNRFMFDRMIELTPGADVDYPHVEDPDVTASRRAELAWV